jgi:acyl-CoA thioester hydrolase
MASIGVAMESFVWPVRVYYEDTDAGGVVYYANYLKYLERARTEFLRSSGFEQDQLRESQGVLFAVRSMNIEYRQPARFNDQLEVITNVSQIGRASIRFEQRIAQIAKDSASRELCEASVQVACLDADRFKPRPIPTEILEALNLER